MDPAQLKAKLDLLSNQRLADLGRLKELSRRCDDLSFQLAERDAEFAGLPTIASMKKPQRPVIDTFQLIPAAIRTKARKEHVLLPSLMNRFLSMLLLRVARRAAARRDYALAEALYQSILMLTPRAFVWRQLGNMLAGQGLFAAAVASFEQAIELQENDAEAWHAKANSLKALDQREEAADALKYALSLDPALANRGR